MNAQAAWHTLADRALSASMNRTALIVFLAAANLVIFAQLARTVVRWERENAEARAAREVAGFYSNPPTLP